MADINVVVCKILGCHRPVRSVGMCKPHYMRERYWSNPKLRQRQADWGKNNRERINANRKKNYRANRERELAKGKESRMRRMPKKYGLTSEQYQAIVAKANGKCQLCNRSRRLVMDHCHVSNQVRGMLCIRCNVAIGSLGDTKEKLIQAVEYLSQGLSK